MSLDPHSTPSLLFSTPPSSTLPTLSGSCSTSFQPRTCADPHGLRGDGFTESEPRTGHEPKTVGDKMVAQRTQPYHSGRESLMSSSSRDLEASGKPDAVLSCHSESSQNTFSKRDQSNESGNRFESSVHPVFRTADPANVRKSLLDGNRDHLLYQARFELMKQEHQVESPNNCINVLQQKGHAQRLESQDAHHGYAESRREHVRKKKLFEKLKFEAFMRWER